MNHPRQSGMTLIELACSLAVLSILAGLAAPSWREWRQRAAATSLVDALTGDLALARITAISRGRATVVCPTADWQLCSQQADWKDGWIVYLDTNRDRIRQAGEPVLSTSQPRQIPNLTFNSTSGRTAIRLLPSGFSYGSNVTVTACIGRRAHAQLVMNNAGRVRIDRKPARNEDARCQSPPA